MRILVLMVLKESPLRLKVRRNRSQLMSSQILKKAKTARWSNEKRPRYGIHKTSGPPLVVKLRGCMQTFVRTTTWKYIAMEVDGLNTVADVKRYIQETEGVRVDRQRLVFSAKRLDDERRLADCDLHNNSVLHLVVLKSKVMV